MERELVFVTGDFSPSLLAGQARCAAVSEGVSKGVLRTFGRNDDREGATVSVGNFPQASFDPLGETATAIEFSSKNKWNKITSSKHYLRFFFVFSVS